MCRKFQYYITVLGLLFLAAGCGELTPPGERGAETGSYTVRAGDTLYSISWGYGLDYREVAAWNNIPPPYLIHAGQQLLLSPPFQQKNETGSKKTSVNTTALPTGQPRLAIKSPPHSTVRGGKNRSSSIRSEGKKRKAPADSHNPIEKTDRAPIHSEIAWRWPVNGPVVTRFDLGSGKKGIDITGRNGQPIYSAAAGDVVYSGNGLLGYGNLVIIKHDDLFLSAYGHNSQLLVKEGDRVGSGQEIAKMGANPKEGAMLHFEIRKEGKPVDPNRYLPKKN